MSNRPTLAYQPALDGLRAVAVSVVVLFHAGVPGFDGGYLGVSMFFTLSGFLITSLLLIEHDHRGTIDLAAFYGRRVRRLLPASLLCVGGVLVLGALTDVFDGVEGLRSHVVGSVFQVANWVFLAGDGSYQDLLAQESGTASPLEHFWSLAIEEQFYWVWPPVVAFGLSRLSGRAARIVAVGTVTVVAAAAAPFTASVFGADAAYWATPARLSEILVGALLAVVIAQRSLPAGVGAMAPPALLGLLVAVVLFPSAGGPAYAGWLPLVGVGSAILILGLQAPGPSQRVLSAGPLVWLGKVSYGVYVFHWPVFVVVHHDRVSLPGPALFAARIALTLALTIVSYHLVEQPIRRGRSTRPSGSLIGAFVASSVALAAALAWAPAGLGEYWNPDAEVVAAASMDEVDGPLESLVPSTSTVTRIVTIPPRSMIAERRRSVDARPAAPASPDADATTTRRYVVDAATRPSADADLVEAFASPVATTVPPLPTLQRPVRIVVTGDSTARALGTGLQSWAAANPHLARVEVVAAPGCGFLDPGQRYVDGVIAEDGCAGWIDRDLAPAVERLRPDVVVAMVTSWDIVDRRWDDGPMLNPFDEPYARRLAADYERLVDHVESVGAGRVVFVRHPIPDAFWLPRVDEQEDPDRHAVVYDLFDRLVEQRPRVAVVPLDRWMADADLDRRRDVRPDGIHPTPEAAAEISERYLGDRLVRIALELP